MRTWTLRTTQGAMTAACVLIAMVAGFREVGARAGRDTDAVDSSLRDGDDVAVGVGNGERLGSAPQPEEAAPAAQTPGRDPDEAGPVVIDPVPVTRIQEIDAGTSTIPLFRVRHAFMTADGLVGVAADPGTVYFLSLDGEFRGSVGRSDAGPGEFRSLSKAWVESVAIYSLRRN